VRTTQSRWVFMTVNEAKGLCPGCSTRKGVPGAVWSVEAGPPDGVGDVRRARICLGWQTSVVPVTYLEGREPVFSIAFEALGVLAVRERTGESGGAAHGGTCTSLVFSPPPTPPWRTQVVERRGCRMGDVGLSVEGFLGCPRGTQLLSSRDGAGCGG